MSSPTKPIYGRPLEFVDELPAIETTLGGQTAEHLAPLRKKPGQWARVYGPCPAESMAANMYARGIKVGDRQGIEKGEFDAAVRTLDGEKFVFARYVGNGS